MNHFLNTNESHLVSQSLLAQLERDPEGAYRTLCDQRNKLPTSNDFQTQLDKEKNALKQELLSFSAAVQQFQNALPAQRSFFRGSDDAADTYRVFCAFLVQFDSIRRSMRSDVQALLTLREQLSRAQSAQTQLLGTLSYLLRHVASSDSQKEKLLDLQASVQESNGTTTQLEEIAKNTFSQIHLLEKQVLVPFLRKAEELSDSKNQGASCSRTGLVSLTAAFRDKCKELLQSLQ